MNLLKSLALAAIFALASCSGDSPACSCDDSGISSSSVVGNSSSSSSTILQTTGLTFVSGQALPPNYVSFSDDPEWTGTVSPGGIITLKVICANEMSELYLKIKSENGYYVRQITAEDIVSSEPESYTYYFTFAFSPELNHVGEMEFSISGKAKV